jgi:acetoin utilization deacetylase AcuC-like enzyme
MLTMQVVFSKYHRQHATELHLPGCPMPCFEIPARAEAILSAVTTARIGELIEPHDFGRDPIQAVHSSEFVEYLKTSYGSSRAFFEGERPVIAEAYSARGWRNKPSGFPGRIGYFSFDTACPILEGTWVAAYWSAQCAITAADLVRRGSRAVYALCRPPGHHAGRDLHGGFCYLNNAAIAARALQQAAPERIAILDIDYHHGNGTQEIFYQDSSVFFCSIHADPNLDYPFFWGCQREKGEGPGEGFNLNLPLPHGTTENGFLTALDEATAAIASFDPAYLILSAGFDFMEGDPVPLGGGFRVGRSGLLAAARRIASLRVPTVIVQEGGYDVEKIGGHVVAFLQEFAN